jgi:hypothetical protein
MTGATTPGRDVAFAGERVDYREWGEHFFAEAISEERVLGAVGIVTGRPIVFGPIGAGPGRIAKVRAEGSIGRATATRLPAGRSDGLIAFRVVLPVELAFEVDLQVETQHFDARLLVPVTLTAVALTGVRIWIEADAPEDNEVHVDVRADGLRASVLQRVVGLEGELRRFVARYVVRELDKPHVREARLIDVSRAIAGAWASIGPRSGHEGAAAAAEA